MNWRTPPELEQRQLWATSVGVETNPSGRRVQGNLQEVENSPTFAHWQMWATRVEMRDESRVTETMVS